MREILEEVVELIARKQNAALASVVSSRGSLPMSRRSKMLVLPDGGQRGTVGGGCLEAEVHAMARLAMASGLTSLRRFTLTETKAGAEGLNCGGTVEILIEPTGAMGDGALEVYRQAVASIDAREEAVMTTLFASPERPADEPVLRLLGKGIVSWKGLRVGTGSVGVDGSLTEWAVGSESWWWTTVRRLPTPTDSRRRTRRWCFRWTRPWPGCRSTKGRTSSRSREDISMTSRSSNRRSAPRPLTSG
jgi:hypothetical protein